MIPGTSRHRSGIRPLGTAALCLVALAVAAMPGCSGCTESPTATGQQKKQPDKKPEKLKPDFEPLKAISVPGERATIDVPAKPGHWTSVVLEAKANNFDFSGRLEASAAKVLRPVDLADTAYYAESSRPAVLPKGQTKLLEFTVFTPADAEATHLAVSLRDRGGSRDAAPPVSLKLRPLPPHQYHLVVLAAEPRRYAYLTNRDSIRPRGPTTEAEEGSYSREQGYHYKLSLLRPDDHVALPSQPLIWSSIAYVLWDGVHPKSLTTEQQKAMLDWLYWGGQIIVSGPKTLDDLRGSFLDPLLPASNGGSATLDAAALAELNANWTLPDKSGSKQPLKPPRPLAGVKLKLAGEGSFIAGTGSLLAERRVGRGRIVVSAFSLSDASVVQWTSFDSLLNGALLRREPREFVEVQTYTTVRWKDQNKAPLDPRLMTTVRYFSRDAHFKAPVAPPPQADDASNDPTAVPTISYDSEGQLEAAEQAEARRQPNVGRWSDNSTVARIARDALKKSAGIEIPRRRFVVWVLGLYLIVLVPLNWTVFRLLGRVEWAWLAVPVTAVAFAGVVIKLAQLDIGFVRSRTEVAVVEAHGGHSQALATRYTALYTALSTSYDLHFDSPSALALPLGTPGFTPGVGQERSAVSLRKERGVELTGLKAISNSTALVHSEHMLELGGTLELKDPDGPRPRLVNGTQLPLAGCGVIRWAAGKGELVPQVAWVGSLQPGASYPLAFLGKDQSDWQKRRDDAVRSQLGDAKQVLNLQSLVRLAERPDEARAGDVRLVAWTDRELEGLRIEPAASQSRQLALIVAHLRFGPLPVAKPDPLLPPVERIPTGD